MKNTYYLSFLFILIYSVNAISQDECMNRPEYTSFTQEQTDAIMDYICTQVDTHVDAPHYAHGSQFLQWHRDYIGGLEEYLANNGHGDLVPFPYWHPCDLDFSTAPNVPNALETCDGYPAMISAQVISDFVQNGSAEIDCEPFDTDKYSCAELCNYETFESFQAELQLDHLGVHNMFNIVSGPTTFSDAESPSVLLFWLWHSFVDDIYLKHQAATLSPKLDIEIELVNQECCEVQFVAPKLCCADLLYWTMDGTINNTMTGEDSYKMSGTVDTWPEYTVSATYQGECGDIKTYTFTFEMEEPMIPELPSSPPTDLQHLCMVDFEPSCYDFSNFGDECFETLEVETSSPKLIASINGTELCLSYIHPAPFTGTVTVTPITSCGAGDPVTWTITANQPQHCDDGGFDGPRNVAQDILFKVYPNPFKDRLILDFKEEDTVGYSLEVINVMGNSVIQYNQVPKTIDTQMLSSGVHIIRITNSLNEEVYLDKFLKI